MIPTKANPEVAWKSDAVRIVVWYEPCPTIFKRIYIIEQALTKDALGEQNWQKVFVHDGISDIIEGFLDQLGISREKYPDNEP
ncbi:MAG: hypothetical protein ACXAC5_04345 [Promethearchaeota archaeon]|jgi:hypothetical protein